MFKLLLVSFLNVSPISLPICCVPSPPFRVFTLVPRPNLFKVPIGFPNASTDLFFHFILERLVSFPLGYHVGNLSWELGFVALIITSRFLVNFCLFLLEAIGENNLGFFFFKAHLKLV